MNVFVTGYPRSGNTWVNRLLSDLLDSPMTTPAPNAENATKFCKTGNGGYTIFKTHWAPFSLWSDRERGVKDPADFYIHDYWRGQVPIVFVQRDPRDVAVSAMFYLDLKPTAANLRLVVLGMVDGDYWLRANAGIYHVQGAYLDFVQGWLDEPKAIKIKYEDLHHNPIDTMAGVLAKITAKHYSKLEIAAAFERLAFYKWEPEYPHSMRRGQVGDWRHHFNQANGALITEALGNLMLSQDYTDSRGWWEGLPK